jgi:hypothetical protein
VPQTGPNVPATDNGRNTDVVPLLASVFNTNGVFSDDTATGKLTGLVQVDAQKGQFDRGRRVRGAVGPVGAARVGDRRRCVRARGQVDVRVDVTEQRVELRAHRTGRKGVRGAGRRRRADLRSAGRRGQVGDDFVELALSFGNSTL